MDIFKLSYVLPHNIYHNRYYFSRFTQLNINQLEMFFIISQYVVQNKECCHYTSNVIFFTTSGGCFPQATETWQRGRHWGRCHIFPSHDDDDEYDDDDKHDLFRWWQYCMHWLAFHWCSSTWPTSAPSWPPPSSTPTQRCAGGTYFLVNESRWFKVWGRRGRTSKEGNSAFNSSTSQGGVCLLFWRNYH